MWNCKAIMHSVVLLVLTACGGDGGDAANCSGYCGKLVSCRVDSGLTTSECMADCTGAVSDGGSACLSVSTELNNCVAGLSCSQAMAFWEESPPSNYPCKAEWDVEQSCLPEG